MKLLVLSDLHNEASVMSPFVDGRRIDTDADVVVLAGDIHEGVQAPIWARQAFPDKEIILVAGNHEFYGRYWKRNLRKIRQKSAQLGIHFLENDAVEIGGIRFLGCTLWTDYCLYGEERRPESMNAAHTLMTDFRLIKLDRKADENQDWREFRVVKLIPQLTLRRHVQSAAWLDAQLALGDPEKTVVVTHHARWNVYPEAIPRRQAQSGVRIQLDPPGRSLQVVDPWTCSRERGLQVRQDSGDL